MGRRNIVFMAKIGTDPSFKKRIPNVVITLGKNGCYVYDGKQGTLVDPIDVKTVDTTGAGETLLPAAW